MSTVHSPKGLRISDEVHTALKVRAAQTGESMGQIAEKALRKELGIMTGARIDLDKEAKPMKYTETTYSENGHDYPAIQVAWADLKAAGFKGDGYDDSKIVDALLLAGAPDWVRNAQGWVDEHGWGLIGPALAVIESQGEYHNVTLIIEPDRLEVRGGFDKAAAWEAALAEAADRYDPDELYSIAVAEAAQEIADALEDAGICGAAQVDDDGPAGARVTATLVDGRRIVIIVDGAASDTGPSVSVHDVTNHPA